MLLVPPWFRAPLGSTQWCVPIRSDGASSTTSHALFFGTDGSNPTVPAGHFAVVVAAAVVVGDHDEYWPVQAPFEWRLVVDNQRRLTGFPCGTMLMRLDGAATAGGFGWNNIMPALPPAPILAPIVVEEGKGGFLEVYDAGGSGTRPVRHGWVTGWLCPRVNDRPGAESFFNQSL